jgi:type II secretory pathway pseudopilin PulG
MKRENGQALVLVLLSLAVVLTLVLYILSRSITDVAVSSREEEAVRAFSAAEAGVERALIIGVGSSGDTQIGDATYNADVSSFAEGTSNFNYPLNLASNDSSTLWFTSHDTNNNLVCDVTHPCFSGNTLKVCWGKPGTSASTATTPAVEVSIFYATTPLSFSTVRIARAALDPNTGRTNNFSDPDSGTCTISGESYAFQKTLTLSSLGIPAGSYGVDGGLLFAKLRMLYNSTESHIAGFDVNFAGNDTLPSQGLLINSTGSSGEANRRLEVFQAWPETPPIFDNVVFSSGGLTK